MEKYKTILDKLRIRNGRVLTGYELINEVPIRDEHGEIADWQSTVVAEGQTVLGLLKFARMKKLDPDTHYIEAEYKDYSDGIPMRDSEKVGHLNEFLKHPQSGTDSWSAAKGK